MDKWDKQALKDALETKIKIKKEGNKKLKKAEKELSKFLNSDNNRTDITMQIYARIESINKENKRIVEYAYDFKEIKYELERNLDNKNTINNFRKLLRDLDRAYSKIEYADEYYHEHKSEIENRDKCQ